MRDIYLSSLNIRETYQCVIEMANGAVWMYLHDLSEKQVIGAAPICCFERLISLADFKKNYKRGDIPSLVEEYSRIDALIPDISIDRIKIIWSQNGNSIVAFIDNKPFAMIISGQKRGFSKALSSHGAWGNKWDDKIFNNTFGEKSLLFVDHK